MAKSLRALWRRMRETRHAKGMVSQLVDIALHKILLNTHPYAYYGHRFYDRELSWDEKSRYVDEFGSRYFPYELNPIKFDILFTDKYVQKALLEGLGLPTSPLITTIGINRPVSTPAQFQEFIESAPADIVIKPISAAGGAGFMRLRKNGTQLYEGTEVVTPAQLWERFTSNLQRGLIVELGVTGTEALNQLNPSSLNTFRVITCKIGADSWIHVCTYLKVGRSHSQVDNRAAGGLLVRIDDTGRTGKAIDVKNGVRELSRHPDTGAQLEGISIQGFRDVVDLAMDASTKLPFMGFLGSDIALTGQGPTIIEINSKPGVYYPQLLYGSLVTDEMVRRLRKHTLFSRRDKTRIQPGWFLKP